MSSLCGRRRASFEKEKGPHNTATYMWCKLISSWVKHLRHTCMCMR